MPRNLLKAFLIPLTLACQLWMITSCNQLNNPFTNNKSEIGNYYSLVGQAKQHFKNNPDSAILYADSALKVAARNAISDTALIPVLFLKAGAYTNKGISDSVMLLFLKARFYAGRTADSALMARSAYKLGMFLHNQEQTTLAEGYVIESLHLYEKSGDEYNIGNACILYGNLLVDQGNNLKAHDYLMKAYTIFDRLDSIQALGVVSMNISSNLKALGRLDEALQYGLIGIEKIALAQDTNNLISAYNDMAIIIRTSKPDTAMYFYKKALDLSRGANPIGAIITRFNLANLYLDKKEFPVALDQFEKVLDLCRKKQLYGGEARVYHAFGEVFIQTKDFAKADFYLYRSIRLADSLGLYSLLPDFRKTLLESYRLQGRMREFAILSSQLMAQKDSLMVKDKSDALAYVERYHEAKKNELNNAYLTEVIRNKESKLLMSEIIIAVVIVALLLLFFLLKRITRLYKERSNAYDVLIRQFNDDRAQREILAKSILNTESLVMSESSGNQESQLLIKHLLKYYKSEKPYLNPKLRVEDIADSLNTTRKGIASALSDYNDSNFVTFTNTYRVEQAIMLMESHEYRNYKMSALATDAGFGSAQSFYRIFQQLTGVLPNYYRKNIVNLPAVNAA